MPHDTFRAAADRPDEPEPIDDLHVLLTGFGVCAHKSRPALLHICSIPTRSLLQAMPHHTRIGVENPSWLAVRALHNRTFTVLPTTGYGYDSPSEAEALSVPGTVSPRMPHTGRKVRITSVQLPVTYADVLAAAPGMHAAPPILPVSPILSSPPVTPVLGAEQGECSPSSLSPGSSGSPPPAPILDAAARPKYNPARGFDFVVHVGVANRAPLRLEKCAHKRGYHSPDTVGAHAPVERVSQAQDASRLDVDDNSEDSSEPGIKKSTVRRYVGERYDDMPDELYTDIDIPQLVTHLHHSLASKAVRMATIKKASAC